jgi:hypothetical protein
MGDTLVITNWNLSPTESRVVQPIVDHGYTTASIAGAGPVTATISVPSGTRDGDLLVLAVCATGTIVGPAYPVIDGRSYPYWTGSNYAWNYGQANALGTGILWRNWHTGDPTSHTVTYSDYGSDPTEILVLLWAFEARALRSAGSAGVTTLPATGSQITCVGLDSSFWTNDPADWGFYVGIVQQPQTGPLTGEAPLTHVVNVAGSALWLTAGYDAVQDSAVRIFDGVSGPSVGYVQADTVQIVAQYGPKYADAALPFLTEFPPSGNPAVGVGEAAPSLQYRDADTGDLLAVHPYSETPDYAPGGSSQFNPDIAYGPGASAIRPDFVYLCGWNDSAIWKLNTKTAATIWRKDGFQSSSTSNPSASTACPVLTPDGGSLYVQNDTTGDLVRISTADGSIQAVIPVIGVHRPFADGIGVVLAPDGTLIFARTQDHSLSKLDMTTGVVTPFFDLISLGLPYDTSSAYLYPWQIAPHPHGDGFAFSLTRYIGGHYYSEIVECSWSGTATNVYDYSNSALWGDRLAMVFGVCYSSDGERIYGVPDTSYPIIWRWDRSNPLAIGGSPWMHCDYRTRTDWIADGAPNSTPGYIAGSGARALWASTVAGVAATQVRFTIPALRLTQRDDQRLRGGQNPTSVQHSGRNRGPNAYL